MTLVKHTLHMLVVALMLTALGCTKKNDEQPSPEYAKLTWNDLQLLNPETGTMSDRLKDLNQQKVKMAGFVTPLTDDAAEIFEFTLVPYPVSCIHSPPPPANQIVMVELTNDRIDPEDLWAPFWIYGTLNIENTNHPQFKAAYRLKATRIEKYQ